MWLVAGHIGAVNSGRVNNDGAGRGRPPGRTRRLDSLRSSSTAHAKSSSIAAAILRLAGGGEELEEGRMRCLRQASSSSRPAPSTPADLAPAADPTPVGSTAAGSPRGRACSPRRRLERGKKKRRGLMGGVHVAFHTDMPRWQATWTKVANSQEITSLRW